jgi:5-methylcytosine-specific restriction protein A
MPMVPPRRCVTCRQLVTTRCATCERVRKQDIDARRGSASERGYGHRWHKVRTAYLRQHPLCVPCEKAGRLTPANVVDHVVPHRGDQALMWDETNFRATCKRCHDQKTARQDSTFVNRNMIRKDT